MNAPAPTHEATLARVAALADQCVMCGLCLTHCPSYRVRREEGESPRGRLAFANAFANRSIEPTDRMRSELDDCLACGVCEVVCPVPVRYDAAIVALRAVLPKQTANSPLSTAVRRLLREPRLLALALRAARTARARLARPLLNALPASVRALVEVAPAAARGRAPVAFTAAEGDRRGALALFRGCAARVFDADTHLAATDVLSRLGYDVHVPQAIHCCGSLAAHEGAASDAVRSEQAAAEIFGALPVDAVIGTASGCQQALELRVLGASAIPGRDLFTWLAADARLAQRPLRIEARHALLHLPCTQHDAPARALQAVLSRVSGLRLSVLPLQPRCCGAAGSYFIHHGAIARPLRDERIEQIRTLAPDLVLTSNVGCRSWLEAGLREAGLSIPVQHPICLIAEALEAP
jgi:glycolate oxidase iron-sulfur subunit